MTDDTTMNHIRVRAFGILEDGAARYRKAVGDRTRHLLNRDAYLTDAIAEGLAQAYLEGVEAQKRLMAMGNVQPRHVRKYDADGYEIHPLSDEYKEAP